MPVRCTAAAAALLCAAAAAGCAVADGLDIRVAPSATSLLDARALVRQELRRRQAASALPATGQSSSASSSSPSPEAFDDITVLLGGGRHPVPAGGLRLTADDSGVAGAFRIVWASDPAATEPARLDGGVNVTGFEPVPRSSLSADAADASRDGTAATTSDPPAVLLWAADAPAALLNESLLATRQLFVDGVRFNRTEVTGAALKLSALAGAVITPDGYRTPSAEPLEWADPTSAEIVADFTWVQHRCAVVSVRDLANASSPVATAAAAATAPPQQTCRWGPQLPGSSPGTSIKQLLLNSWEECQQACCDLEEQCKGIVFHPPPKHPANSTGGCYLLDRTVEGNYVPGNTGFAADMNGPPPPPMRAEINISQPCFDIARVKGYGELSYPDRVENVGYQYFTAPGQWWLDRRNRKVVVSAAASPTSAMASVEEVLLNLDGVRDVVWANVTFEHTTWLQPGRPTGYVERYGNVYFGDVAKDRLLSPPGAAMVDGSSNVSFDGCHFERLGAWGLRLFNATQDASVRHCTFHDLSGGGVSVGDVGLTNNVTDPALQMARITVEDNDVVRVGVEYHGAPGLHSFCMRDSSFSFNTIRDVSYTGISYNWPNPQGPTTGPQGDLPKFGYSANNVVEGNDVSLFMRYMNDGGGIHTIGRSLNTSVRGNYFHQLAAGTPGEVSQYAQSIIYVDNWSCDFNITNNVVDDCPGTKQGYYFFQGAGPNGLAHDNEVTNLAVRNGGALSGHSVACNCSGVDLVPEGSPLPAWAQAVAAQAGRRS